MCLCRHSDAVARFKSELQNSKVIHHRGLEGRYVMNCELTCILLSLATVYNAVVRYVLTIQCIAIVKLDIT